MTKIVVFFLSSVAKNGRSVLSFWKMSRNGYKSFATGKEKLSFIGTREPLKWISIVLKGFDAHLNYFLIL